MVSMVSGIYTAKNTDPELARKAYVTTCMAGSMSHGQHPNK
jgi:hypothetical protein